LKDEKSFELSGKRILITGGAGMIGSTIAHLAVAAGAKVTILDALLPLYGGNLFNLKGIEDEVRFVKGDIRHYPLVEKLVSESELIYNLAAQVSYIDSAHDPFLDLEINCRGHLNVLEAVRKKAPGAKIIFSSSRFVYGSIEYTPVDERHPLNCLSIYGIHKLAAEKYYTFYHKYYGLKTVIFRIANPYGPRQQMKHSKYGIINWFIRLALEGKPLTIFGEGDQIRDYIFVEDLARGMLAASSPTLYHDIFNIGSGVGTRFRDMVKLVAKEAGGAKVVHLPFPKSYAFTETGDYITDISKIKKRLGWEPKTSLEEGIRKTVEYYRKFKDNYW